MASAGIQLYTLREVDEPFARLLELVGEAGFDGVEFAYRVTEEEPEAVASAMKAAGLGAAGAHVSIDDIEDDAEGVAERYHALDCASIVVPWLDEAFFDSADGVERAANRLSDAADDLDGHGLDLLYHNHTHEFVDLGGETAFDALVDATDDRVGIELDVGLAALGGADPVALLERLGGRTPLVHLKDVDLAEGGSVPLDEGDVDLAGCADAAAAAEWLIYEYEGADPVASLGDAAARTRELC